ncbi:phage NrS-1 polymerase family protein [Peptoanaerobacter stomatis]
MQELKQWILWKYEDTGGKKLSKVPYQINGLRAKPNDKTTWSDYNTVKAVFYNYDNEYDGIGFVFTAEDDYVGIDLDFGIDDAVKDDIINTLDSYTELSPSGKGYHIIVKGKKTVGSNRKNNIEIYDNLRYFTITENIINNKNTVQERQKELDYICKKYLCDASKQSNNNTGTTTTSTLSDEEIIRLAGNAKNGDIFKSLLSGDITGYESHSEADIKLCSILAFWCGRNKVQLDRIFRTSGLYRPKWDEKHKADGRTYGQLTIDMACSNCVDVYKPKQENTDIIFPDWLETKNGNYKLLFTSANTEVMLNHLGIYLKWDVIKRKVCIEQSGNILKSNEVNIDNLVVVLADRLKKIGINPNSNELRAQVSYIAHKSSFNHIKDFLIENSKRRITTNAVSDYLSCFHFEEQEEFCKKLMQKWFIQTVAMIFNDGGSYGAEGVLTFIGGQGIGKTRSLALPFISVIPEYYYKKEATYSTDKDSHIQLTSFWAVEFSEMIRSFKDIETFKAFITSPNDVVRLPYGRVAGDYPRYTSFCGTTNDETFLKDIHNRRFWTVKLLKVDFEKINNINFLDFWAELYNYFKIFGQFAFRLTDDERRQLEEVNKKYRIKSNEEIYLLEILDWDADKSKWIYKTSTELSEDLSTGNNKLTPRKIGRALTAIGYDKNNEELHKRILKGYSLYKVPPPKKIYL